MQQTDISQPLMTFPEVQTYLQIKSRKTLLKYIRTGDLPAFKLGGTRWRILRKDVDAFTQQTDFTLNPNKKLKDLVK